MLLRFSNTILQTINGSMKKIMMTLTSRKDFLSEGQERLSMKLITAIESPEKLQFCIKLKRMTNETIKAITALLQ